jgi:transposase
VQDPQGYYRALMPTKPEVGIMSTITLGLDLGDRSSTYCLLDAEGRITTRGKVASTPIALQPFFAELAVARVILEVGTHSPWVSRMAADAGHEVIVANPRRVRLISAAVRKNDDLDAEALARLGRVDPQLLSPIRHRGEVAQADLAQIRSRDALVRTRALLVNHVRGAVKAVGARTPSTTVRGFTRKVRPMLPPPLATALTPVLDSIDSLTTQIALADRTIAEVARTRYPETECLRQIAGVGPITALCFVLTLEDPHRFPQSRGVGAYLGLCPREHQSGDRAPQLRITKAGDPMLRRLLVTAAHYILGPFGPDTAIRRWGLTLAARGGANGKKRAIVAVARKLATILHHLWITGDVYQPLDRAA